MYSWEIQELLEYKKYLLSSIEYVNMVMGSNQISRIQYKPFENTFEVWTKDNYYWKFKVYYEKEKTLTK